MTRDLVVLGIDPGLRGAVAAILPKGAPLFWDSPRVVIKGRNRLDPDGMADILRTWRTPDVHVFLEQVHTMPREGPVGAFTFGRGLGIWEGILAAFQMPRTMVSPNTWTARLMRDMPDRRKASRRVRVRQLYPSMDPGSLNEGRVDALLIATYGVQVLQA